MIRNYLKTALRNFYRDRGMLSVNLLGLVAGLAVVILLSSYIRYELSYDQSYSNAPRVFRLLVQGDESRLEEPSIKVPVNLGYQLAEEFPQIAMATTLKYDGITSFVLNEGLVDMSYITADSNFFRVFNIPFLYGNPNTALKENDNMVITRETAEQFFGEANAVGETMVYRNIYGEERMFRITGVIREIPANTHFKADAITALNPGFALGPLSDEAMIPLIPQYVLLRENTQIGQVEEALPAFYEKYGVPDRWALDFQPVPSIHLHSKIVDEQFANSDIRYLYIFGLIALMVLAVACVNYINLATVRSLKRAREIGMRKVLGSTPAQLRIQFLGESFLFFGLALPLAVLLSYVVWPLFMEILNIQADVSYLFSWPTILTVVSVSLVSALLSGAYPAFFLSVLRPISTLKNSRNSFKVNFNLRKALIVLQFAVTVMLVIAAIVINKQLHLLNNAQLGYNKDHLLVLESAKYPAGSASFKQELRKHSSIEAVSVSSWRIGEPMYLGTASADSSGNERSFQYTTLDVDYDFLRTMQLKLLDGRFAPSRTAASSAHGNEAGTAAADLTRPIVLSREAATRFGLKDLVGKPVDNGNITGTVIGIVDDFNGVSLRENMPPVVLYPQSDVDLGHTYIRIAPGNLAGTLRYIEDTYRKMFPYQKADLSFVDDRLQQLYTSEQRLAKMFNLFVTITIIIVSVGLFSLITLVIQQRTREIGIRKILGANIARIVKLLTADFLYLVLFALLLSAPLAWWAMNTWLEDFTHHIELQWWMFFAAGLLAVLIVLLSVSLQALRAALANPVKSLRSD